jgi:hypothetical protein
MRYDSAHVGAVSVGLLLMLAGLWFMAREFLGPGPWFVPATLAVLTAASFAGWAVTRRVSWLTGLFFLLSWTAYKALDVWFGGKLPYSFLPAFWGIGFMVLYTVGTRPYRWPLIPASLLLGLATVMYVVGVGIETARYWVPAALLLWGLYMIVRGARGGSEPDQGGRPELDSGEER